MAPMSSTRGSCDASMCGIQMSVHSIFSRRIGCSAKQAIAPQQKASVLTTLSISTIIGKSPKSMPVPQSQIVPEAPPVLRVSAETLPGVRKEFEFVRSFRIGRIEECEVCIKNEFVSRHHVEIAFE